MTGEAFEAQLGHFLRQVAAFPLIKSMLEASTKFQPLPNQVLQAQGALQEWHQQVIHHLGQVVDIIRQSLYEEFSGGGFDSARATEVYRALFEALGITDTTRWSMPPQTTM